MRTSNDETATDGTILNGFDYELQVWVRDGVIQACGHPVKMLRDSDDDSLFACCNAGQYAGLKAANVKGHEVRS